MPATLDDWIRREAIPFSALAARSLTDFDWLAVLDSTTYTRGSRPLAEGTASSKKPES
jgi:hypothetical protein